VITDALKEPEKQRVGIYTNLWYSTSKQVFEQDYIIFVDNVIGW